MTNEGRLREVGEQLIGRMIPLLNPFWGMLPRRLWTATKDFFVYPADFITANGTQVPVAPGNRPVQTNIQSDSHFLIMAGVMTVFQNDDTTVVANPAATVQIESGGAGRSVIGMRGTHISNMFGTGQLPAYWPYPKIVQRASTLVTTITNLSAVVLHVRIGYVGFKVWDDKLLSE